MSTGRPQDHARTIVMAVAGAIVVAVLAIVLFGGDDDDTPLWSSAAIVIGRPARIGSHYKRNGAAIPSDRGAVVVVSPRT